MKHKPLLERLANPMLIIQDGSFFNRFKTLPSSVFHLTKSKRLKHTPGALKTSTNRESKHINKDDIYKMIFFSTPISDAPISPISNGGRDWKIERGKG